MKRAKITEAADIRRYLAGVWNMIENGMQPSAAILCGNSPQIAPRVAQFLGVQSLDQLDRLRGDELRLLLGTYTI